jgi:hypothetical protein
MDVRSGNYEISADSNPMFLYEGSNYDEEQPQDGLMLGEFLVAVSVLYVFRT